MPKCWTSLMVMNPVVCARGFWLSLRPVHEDSMAVSPTDADVHES
jgi:hypothetical protein